MKTEQVLEALKAANAAPFAPKVGPRGGCGRAYVCVRVDDRETLTALAKACKTLGLIYNRKGLYGTGRNAIYIGYDNADGRALAKSEVFAETLTAYGLPAYSDAVGD